MARFCYIIFHPKCNSSALRLLGEVPMEHGDVADLYFCPRCRARFAVAYHDLDEPQAVPDNVIPIKRVK